MSLYNKYRPDTIDGLYGNKDLKAYMKKVLSDDKLPHVILLYGPTGCGKTTIARIIGKELNCSDMDTKEINTADFRGIDTVRDLIQNSRYGSMRGDARIWIIDEVHKMTTDAQNAFLKLLEDTPSHGYFILATTDPEKLLPTVRGRCMQLQVSPLNDDDMFSLLRRIVKGEKKRLNMKVYKQIIADSFGLPRNAIQVLERVLNVPEENQMETAQQSAELYSESIELCRALIQGKGWGTVSKILTGLKNQDPESIRRHVLGYAGAVLLKKGEDHVAHVMEEFEEPLYNIGFPGLELYCYRIIKG